MKLSDGTITSVAQYSFTNGTWESVGSGTDLPGPATAIEVNDGNVNSIFAAGRWVHEALKRQSYLMLRQVKR
jgi:hypothetical protein